MICDAKTPSWTFTSAVSKLQKKVKQKQTKQNKNLTVGIQAGLFPTKEDKTNKTQNFTE